MNLTEKQLSSLNWTIVEKTSSQLKLQFNLSQPLLVGTGRQDYLVIKVKGTTVYKQLPSQLPLNSTFLAAKQQTAVALAYVFGASQVFLGSVVSLSLHSFSALVHDLQIVCYQFMTNLEAPANV